MDFVELFSTMKTQWFNRILAGKYKLLSWKLKNWCHAVSSKRVIVNPLTDYVGAHSNLKDTELSLLTWI